MVIFVREIQSCIIRIEESGLVFLGIGVGIWIGSGGTGVLGNVGVVSLL